MIMPAPLSFIHRSKDFKNEEYFTLQKWKRYEWEYGKIATYEAVSGGGVGFAITYSNY